MEKRDCQVEYRINGNGGKYHVNFGRNIKINSLEELRDAVLESLEHVLSKNVDEDSEKFYQ